MTSKIDLARETASDVLTQWTGVDIDWRDVESELAAHWADATEEPFTDSEFRSMVAREIQEWAKRVVRDLVRQDVEELDDLEGPAAAQIARWRGAASDGGDRNLLAALDCLGDKTAADIYAGTFAKRNAQARRAEQA